MFVVWKNGIFILQAIVNWMGVHEKEMFTLFLLKCLWVQRRRVMTKMAWIYIYMLIVMACVFAYLCVCIRLHMCLHTLVCVVGCCDVDVCA